MHWKKIFPKNDVLVNLAENLREARDKSHEGYLKERPALSTEERYEMIKLSGQLLREKLHKSRK
jgi:hypothetical protein